MSLLGEVLGSVGGSALGNFFLPGVGGFVGGYLGDRLAGGNGWAGFLPGLSSLASPSVRGAFQAPFEHFSDVLSSWGHDPERAFLGINTPFESKAWGTLLGKDYTPNMNMYGGMTEVQKAAAEAGGIDMGLASPLYKTADTIAGYYGGNALGGALGGGAGGSAADQGIGYAGLDSAGASSLGSEGFSAGLGSYGSTLGSAMASADLFRPPAAGAMNTGGGGGNWMDVFSGWGNNPKDWMNKILKTTGGWKNLGKLGLGLYGFNRMQAAKRAANAPIDVNSSPEYGAALDAAQRSEIASGGFGSGKMAAAAASAGPQIYNQIWQRQQAQAGAGGNADLGSILMLASMMGN